MARKRMVNGVEYTIVTNNVPRFTTYGGGGMVPRGEFDYLSDDEFASREFVKYRGDWYDLGDVQIAPNEIRSLGWDGFNPDTYWSGIAFRYFDSDGYLLDDMVVMARIAIL